MHERLNARDVRFVVVCLALLAAAVWFAAANFYRAFPEASIDFRVSRGEAAAIAGRFLGARGQSVAGYRHASRFSFDGEAKTFLERELGLQEANRLMGDGVRLWRWSHRWFRPQQKEEYRVEVTPRGETVGYRHEIPEAAARPSLDAAQARALAEEFLATMGRAPETLEYVEGSSVARPARTDHVFTWKQRGFDVRDATYRFEVIVLGNEIGGYREYLKVPEAWLRGYERLRSKNMAAQSADTAVLMVLVVGLLVTLVTRVRARDVRWGRASMVGAAGAVLFFLSSWNAFPLEEFGYPTTDSYASFIARRVLEYVTGALAAGGLLFVLTAGAEPLYRQHFGGQISLGNLFRARSLRTKSFFKGAVLGLALTGIFVAYQTGFYLLAYRFGAWSPADVPYSDMLNTRFPWLFVLFGGFLPAVSEEFLFRMFAVPWLRKAVRSLAAAIILAGFIWGFGHAGYPQQPFYIRGVEVGIGGVALGIILLKWGILPCLVWHYSVDALYTALLLLRSNNTYFMLSGAASAGIMALPAVIAFIAYLRRGGFAPEAELTNAAEGTSQPEAEAAAPAEPVSAHQAWSARRRVAAAAVLAVGLLGLLLPVEKFGGEPRFALDKDQARAAADAFLAGRGFEFQTRRTVAVPANRADRDTIKYFLERRPVTYLAETYRDVVPMHVWGLRYYRPLEKEEARVSVHPETGRITGFRHELPEDRAGADLDAEAARRIAGDFLTARGFDLAALELKETTSERKKARGDHALVWEARPGDPRNLDEARYRVRVEVAGDRVSAFTTSWKLPEAFVRARAARNALSTALLVLRIAVLAGLVLLGLWLLVAHTRKRQLRWRAALLAAAPVALVGVAGSLVSLPMAMQGYDTAVPLETFRAVLAAGVVIAGLGLFLGAACAAGVLLSLYPGAAVALKRASRRAAGLDALLAAAAAIGLALAAGQIGWLLKNRFHAQAIFSPSAPEALGSLAPAFSAVAGAVQETLFGLAVLALALWAARKLPNRTALAAALVVLPAAFVPGSVHTPGEFALHYAILLAGAAAALAFIWFARGNLLAYGVAVWAGALARRALDLWSQPAYRLHGWVALAVLAATLLWVALPAFTSGRKEAARAG